MARIFTPIRKLEILNDMRTFPTSTPGVWLRKDFLAYERARGLNDRSVLRWVAPLCTKVGRGRFVPPPAGAAALSTIMPSPTSPGDTTIDAYDPAFHAPATETETPACD